MKEKKENSEHYLENSPYFLNLEKPHKNCLVCNFEIKILACTKDLEFAHLVNTITQQL